MTEHEKLLFKIKEIEEINKAYLRTLSITIAIINEFCDGRLTLDEVREIRDKIQQVLNLN